MSSTFFCVAIADFAAAVVVAVIVVAVAIAVGRLWFEVFPFAVHGVHVQHHQSVLFSTIFSWDFRLLNSASSQVKPTTNPIDRLIVQPLKPAKHRNCQQVYMKEKIFIYIWLLIYFFLFLENFIHFMEFITKYLLSLFLCRCYYTTLHYHQQQEQQQQRQHQWWWLWNKHVCNSERASFISLLSIELTKIKLKLRLKCHQINWLVIVKQMPFASIPITPTPQHRNWNTSNENMARSCFGFCSCSCIGVSVFPLMLLFVCHTNVAEDDEEATTVNRQPRTCIINHQKTTEKHIAICMSQQDTKTSPEQQNETTQKQKQTSCGRQTNRQADQTKK